MFSSLLACGWNGMNFLLSRLAVFQRMHVDRRKLGLFAALLCASSVFVSRAHAAPPLAVPDCRMLPNAACPRAMAAETPRGIALGTGMRAAALSASALAYSPAALAFGHLYHIEGNVDYLGGYDTVALGGAVTD